MPITRPSLALCGSALWFIVGIVLLAPSAAEAQTRCVIGSWCPTVAPDGNLIEYLVLPTSAKSWTDAFVDCNGRFATLVSIPDSTTRDVITAVLPVASWHGSWSGLAFDTARSDYYFTTGERFQMDILITAAKASCYTLIDHPTGLAFNATPCDAPRKVACQRRAKSTDWTPAPGVNLKNEIQLKFFTAAVSQTTAQQQCRAIGATLGYIPSTEALASLTSSVGRFFSASTTSSYAAFGYWTGLQLDLQSGRLAWITSHGETPWIPGVSNLLQTPCIFVNTWGRVGFQTGSCGDSRPFICSRVVPSLKIIMPTMAQFAPEAGMPSGAQSMGYATVWLDPPQNQTSFLAVDTSHPQRVLPVLPFVSVPPFGVGMIPLALMDWPTQVDITVSSSDPSLLGIKPKVGTIKLRGLQTTTVSLTRSASRSHSQSLYFINATDNVTSNATMGNMTNVSTTTAPPPNGTAMPPPPPPVKPPFIPFGYPTQQNWTVTAIPSKKWFRVGEMGTISLQVLPSLSDLDPTFRTNVTVTFIETNGTMTWPLGRSFRLDAALPVLPIPRFTTTTAGSYQWSYGVSVQSINNTFTNFTRDSVYAAYANVSVVFYGKVRPIILAPTVFSRLVGDTHTITVRSLMLPTTGTLTVLTTLGAGSNSTVTSLTPNNRLSLTNTNTSDRLSFEFKCIAEGVATIQFSIQTTPAVHPDFDGQFDSAGSSVSVACSNLKPITLSTFKTTQRVNAVNKQTLALYVRDLPTVEQGWVGLRILVRNTSVLSMEGNPFPTWNSSSQLDHSFSLTGVQPGTTDVLFSLAGPAAQFYSLPNSGLITLTVEQPVNIALVGFPTQLIAGVEGTFFLNLPRLPTAVGGRLRVSLVVDHSAVQFTPSTLVFVGGSQNSTNILISAKVSTTLATPSNLTFALALGLESAEEFSSPSNVTLTIFPSYNLGLSTETMRLRPGETGSVNITVSALPQPGRSVRVDLSSPMIPYYFTVSPTFVIFSSTGATFRTVKVTSIREFPNLDSAPVPLDFTAYGSGIDAYLSSTRHLTIDLWLIAAGSIIVQNVPITVYAEDPEGEQFSVTLTQDLTDGQSVTVQPRVSPRFATGLEFRPKSRTWLPGDLKTAAFTVIAWRPMVDVEMFFVVTSLPTTLVSPRVSPIQNFTFSVVDQSNIVPILSTPTNTLFVGQTTYLSLRLYRRPSASASFLSFITVTPGYNGTDRSLLFTPQFLRFQSEAVAPLEHTLRVTAAEESNDGSLQVTVAGPRVSEFTPYNGLTLIIKRLTVTVSSLPEKIIVGDTVPFNVSIDQLPTCGSFSVMVSCDGCDAFTVEPSTFVWTSLSKLSQQGLVTGVAVGNTFPLRVTVAQSCGENGDVLPKVVLSRSNISVVSQFRLQVVNGIDSSKRSFSGVVGSAVSLLVWVPSEYYSIKGTTAVKVEMFAEDKYDLFSLLINSAGAKSFVPLGARDFPFNVVFRTEAPGLVSEAFFPVTVLAPQEVILEGLREVTSLAVGSSLTFRVSVASLPPEGILVCTLNLGSGLRLTSAQSTLYFSTTNSQFYVVTITATAVNSGAVVSFVLSGSGSPWYTPIASHTLRTFNQIDVTILNRMTGGVPLSQTGNDGTFPLAVGSQLSFAAQLSSAPTNPDSVVWLLAQSKPEGFIQVIGRQTYWTPQTGFALTKNFDFVGVFQPSNVTINWLAYSPNDEYRSPIRTSIVVNVATERSVTVLNHRTMAFAGTTFNVTFYPSELPTTSDLTMIPQVMYYDDSKEFAGNVTISPASFTWRTTDASVTQKVFYITATNVSSGSRLQVSYFLTGTRDFASSISPVKDLFIVNRSTIGVSLDRPLIVMGPQNSVNVQIYIAAMPASGLRLRVYLTPATLQYVTMTPNEVYFSPTDQPNLIQNATLTCVAPFLDGPFPLTFEPFGPARSEFNSSTIAVSLVQQNSFIFSLTPATAVAYDGSPLIIEVYPTIPVVDTIGLAPVADCPTNDPCANSLLFPSDYNIDPTYLAWTPGSQQRQRITITAYTAGKTFLLRLLLRGAVNQFIAPQAIRVTFPIFTFIQIRGLPSTMYVGYNYPITFEADRSIAETTLQISATQSEGRLSLSPSTVSWDVTSPAAIKGMIITPTTAGATNLTFAFSVSSPGFAIFNPGPFAITVLPSRAVLVQGIPQLMFSEGSSVAVTFSLAVPTDPDELLDMVVSTNDTAIDVQPNQLSLIDSSAILQVSLVALPILQSSRNVLITFNTKSPTGRYVANIPSAVIQVQQKKSIRLTLSTDRVPIGATAQLLVQLAALPTPGATLRVGLNFSAASNSISVHPTEVYFTEFSPMTRVIEIRGKAQTAVNESLAVRGLGCDEYHLDPQILPFRVESAVQVYFDIPYTLVVGEDTVVPVTLGRNVTEPGTAIVDMLLVTIEPEPYVASVLPSPVVSFNSNDPLTKYVTVRGVQSAGAVRFRVFLTGALSAYFTPPDERVVNVVNRNVVIADLPSTLEIQVGLSRNFTVSVPTAIESRSTFVLTPVLTCSTFTKVLEFAPTSVIWREGEIGARSFQLNALDAGPPCTLTFSPGGNTTRVIGNGGVWTIVITLLPMVKLQNVPKALTAGAVSNPINIVLDNFPKQTVFSVDIRIKPEQWTTAVVALPSTLAWSNNDPLDKLVKGFTVSIPRLVPNVTILLNPTANADLNLTMLPRSLFFQTEPPAQVQFSALPTDLYLGSVNSKVITVTLSELPRPGETVSVSIAFSGTPNSIIISPSSFTWIGGESQGTSRTASLTGVSSQSYTSLTITTTGSPRFATPTITTPLVIRDLLSIQVNPDIPTTVYAGDTIAFTFTVPNVVNLQDIPLALAITPQWLGIPNCLTFTPPNLRFDRLSTSRSVTTTMFVNDHCGDGVFQVLVQGWNIFALRPYRVKLVTVSRTPISVSPLPPRIRVGDVFFVQVDLVIPLNRFDRVHVGFYTVPGTPCLSFSPTHITFVGGDNKPILRLFRVEASCILQDTAYTLITDTSLSNSSRHTVNVLPQLFNIYPNSTTAVPYSFEWVDKMYEGAAHAIQVNVTAFSALNASVFDLSLNATLISWPNVTGYQSAPIVTLDNTFAISPNSPGLYLVPSGSDPTFFSVKLTGGFPGGMVRFRFLNSTGGVVFSRVVEVIPRISATTGYIAVRNSNRSDFAFADQNRYPVPDPSSYIVVGQSNPAPFTIYRGEDSRALLSVSLSAAIQPVSQIPNLTPTIILTPVLNDSSVKLTFEPPVLEWELSRDTARFGERLYIASNQAVTQVVELRFVLSGTGTRYVDASSISNITFIIRLQDLLQIKLCSLPSTIYPGPLNAVPCTISSPRLFDTSLSLVFTGSADSVRIVPPSLVWDGTSNSSSQTALVEGVLVSSAPAVLTGSVLGRFYDPVASSVGRSTQVTVIPLIQVALLPQRTSYTLYAGSTVSLSVSPNNAAILLKADSDAVNASFNSLGGTVDLRGIRETNLPVKITPSLDPASPLTSQQLPPPSFEVKVRTKKASGRQSSRGTLEILDVFVDVENTLELWVKELPDEGELIVTPQRSDTYIVFPSSFAFSPTSSKSILFTFIGVREAAASPLVIAVTGTALGEFDYTPFQTIQIAIRRRVEVLAPNIEPVNRLQSRQWVGYPNRQTIELQLINRTTDSVYVRPNYEGPADAVQFLPSEVVFFPIFSGHEPQQFGEITIVGLKSAFAARLSLDVLGPLELNWRTIEVGEIEFAEMRQTIVDRVGFQEYIFIRESNQRKLSIRLDTFPDTNPVDLNLAIDGSPAGGLLAVPNKLHWDIRPSGSPPLSISDQRALLTKDIFLTGVLPGTFTLQLTLLSDDSRFNATLPNQKFTLKVRPLLQIVPLFQNRTAYTSIVPLYVGSRNQITIRIALDDFPENSEAKVTVTPGVSVPVVLLSTNGRGVDFGRNYNSGLKWFDLQLNGIPRDSNGTVVDLPPRRTRLFLPVVAPSEYEPSVPEIVIDVYDLLTFEVRNFPSLPIVVGEENPVYFQVRPHDLLTGDVHVLLTPIPGCVQLIVGGDTLFWNASDQGERWKTVRMHGVAELDRCTVSLQVDFTASSPIFVQQAFYGTLSIGPRPRLSLLTPNEVRANVIRTTGFPVKVRLSNGQFLEHPTIGPLSNGSASTRPFAIAISSSVPSVAEPNSVDFFVRGNVTALVTLTYESNRTVAVLNFGPNAAFSSFSVETITIRFIRDSIAANVSLDATADRVVFTLGLEQVQLMPAAQQQAISQVFSVLTLLNGAFFLGSATVPAKLITTLWLPVCPSLRPSERDLWWNEKLVPLTISSLEDLGDYAEVAFSNLLTIAIALAAHGLLVAARWIQRRRGSYSTRDLSSIAALSRFPAAGLVALFFWFQAISMNAFHVLMYSPNAILRVSLGFVFILLVAGVPVVLFLFLVLDFKCEVVNIRERKKEQKKAKKEVKGKGAKGSRPDGEADEPSADGGDESTATVPQGTPNISFAHFWTPHHIYTHPKDPFFVLRWGHLFQELKPNRRWYFVFDLAVVGVLALLEGATWKDHNDCNTKLGLVMFLFFIQLVVSLVLRPFDRAFHNAFLVSYNFVLWIVSLLVLSGSASQAGAYWGLDVAGFLIILITVVYVIKTAIDIILFFLDAFQISKALKARDTVKLEAADEDDDFDLGLGEKAKPLLDVPSSPKVSFQLDGKRKTKGKDSKTASASQLENRSEVSIGKTQEASNAPNPLADKEALDRFFSRPLTTTQTSLFDLRLEERKKGNLNSSTNASLNSGSTLIAMPSTLRAGDVDADRYRLAARHTFDDRRQQAVVEREGQLNPDFVGVEELEPTGRLESRASNPQAQSLSAAKFASTPLALDTPSEASSTQAPRLSREAYKKTLSRENRQLFDDL